MTTKKTVQLWLFCLAMTAQSMIQANAAEVTVTMKSLSAQTANSLALGAFDECSKRGYHVSAAVVGRDGHLLSFIRSPLAGPHTVDVATAKAYTAASFQTPTTTMMQNMKELAFSPRVLLVGGGLPINIGGHFYGGVGVSGAPFEKVLGDIDEACAKAGIDAVREDIEFAD
jgi:uncharacterized protein GlcG (DUF336 family)